MYHPRYICLQCVTVLPAWSSADLHIRLVCDWILLDIAQPYKETVLHTRFAQALVSMNLFVQLLAYIDLHQR